MSDEFLPFLVSRAQGQHLHFAMLDLEGGQPGLAMFLEADAAQDYVSAAEDSSAWQVQRPGKSQLMDILRRCHAAGVRHAVLDPNRDATRRLFDLEQVLDSQ